MAIRVDTPHRCPFCHDGVHATAAKIACDGCMAWHHRECWGAYGARCGACGAAQPAATRADREYINDHMCDAISAAQLSGVRPV